MVYDGLIGLKYSDFKEEGVGYIDSARKGISLEAEDVMGYTKTGTVFVLFNILSEDPMVISEKFEVAREDEASIKKSVEKFNEINKEFVSVIEETGGKYSTVVTTRRDIYDIVSKVL